ncbi:HNH endonuclease [Antribacter sp. KLBMP9083]|uniref:HNH endonuclease n=1 Tax=Antribacter soli TaxID=2910976 RepID=A0AA41U6S9_9MICO|nr:HNH endonuclease signature motif containing protein [Antribacter soli]MCF4120766.1 HNH endonuclease [Antribacter soli]
MTTSPDTTPPAQPTGLGPESVRAVVPAYFAEALSIPARPSMEDYQEAVAEAVELQEQMNALAGRQMLAVARASRLATALEDQILATDTPRVRELDPDRAAELARRAVTTEIAKALTIGPRSSAQLLDTAVVLTDVAPRTLATLCAGTVTARHAHLMAGVVGGLEPETAASVEATVLAPTPTSPVPGPETFARRLRRARDLAHPVPLEVRHADAVEQRGVWVDPAPDGMATLTALLPAEVAHAAHDRLTQTARAAGIGDGSRTLAQLRADVLADLLLDDGTTDLGLTRAAEAGALSTTGTQVGVPNTAGTGGATGDDSDTRPANPAAGGATGAGMAGPPALDCPPDPREPGVLARIARRIIPKVHVTVPVQTLLGGSAPATLDGHIPLDPDTARALVAHAPSFKRVLTHPETGAVLSVGRDSYTVPADLRDWLLVRDVTCRFPGCGRPALRTDLDHTTDWGAGGGTSADNLAHLCRAHHTLKHQTAWTLQTGDTTGNTTGQGVRATGSAASAPGAPGDGALTWTSPAGRRYASSSENAITTGRLTPATIASLVPGTDLDLDEPDGPPPF